MNPLFSARLKEALNTRKMKASELSEKTGVSPARISQYLSNKYEAKSDGIFLMARALNVSEGWLMGYDVPMNRGVNTDLSTIPNIIHIKKQSFPLLGNIAAGQPITAEENIECYIDAVGGIKADYALHVKGDSMIGARIYDGDIVFIHTQATVDNGQIAAVLIDDEATLKRVYQTGDTLTLVAENPAYQPMVYTPGSGKEIRILGKAVAFQSIVK